MSQAYAEPGLSLNPHQLVVGPESQFLNFPGGVVVKNLLVNAGDIRVSGSISGSGRSSGERNGNPLQYSCLENSMDRGSWWVTVHGITKSQT